MKQSRRVPKSVSDSRKTIQVSADPLVDPELALCMAENAKRPASDVTAMTPQETREVYAQSRVPWNRGLPQMAEVRRGSLPAAHVEVPEVTFVPHEAEAGATIYLHGGGWVMGGTATHDGIMRRVAELSRRTVIGLDYPLAPESRRSATLSVCISAVGQALERCEGPAVLAGDSAGAELSLSVALSLRDQGARLPDGLCLAYPALWPRFETASHVRSGDGRFGLSTDKMRSYWGHYLGGEDALPEWPNVSGLPRSFVLGAALDCLLDDARDLARMLEAAGVEHELQVLALLHLALDGAFDAIELEIQLRQVDRRDVRRLRDQMRRTGYEVMRAFRHADQSRIDAAQLKRLVELLGFPDRGAPIRLAGDQHCWRSDVSHERQR